MQKQVQTPVGDITVTTPRDRDASFDPQFIKKRETMPLEQALGKGKLTQSNVELYDQIMIKTNDRSMAIRALRKNSEEIGGLIIQNRKEDSSEYTMSKFTALGKDMTISGYIIEPAGPSTPTANQNRRVPEGLYYLDNYSSSN